MNAQFNRRLAAVLVVWAATTATAAELRTAADVLALAPAEAARAHSIALRGVVTYTDPSWSSQFFMQDDTGGVFVGVSAAGAPSPGDVVEVRGQSHPGAYAPFVANPEWRKTGTASLPAARAVTIERFASGLDDGLRVEAAGRVRQVRAEPDGIWRLVLNEGGYRYEVVLSRLAAGAHPESWIAARVRVRGVLAVDYQLQRRGLSQVRVFVVSSDDLDIEQGEPFDPRARPALPLARIGQYRRDHSLGERGRVIGVVVAHPAPGVLALEDDSGGLLVKVAGESTVQIGSTVEAIGFEATENHLPVLEDALPRVLPERRPMPAPARPSMEDLGTGKYHACLVTVTATLLERYLRLDANTGSAKPAPEHALLLQSDGATFTASLPIDAAAGMPPPEPGSKVAVTGLCLSQANAAGRLTGFRLQLADANGLRLLAPPPWLNNQRLSYALAITFGGLAICGGWILSFSRKNHRLREEIAGREKLAAELRDARDLLAARVDERTAQLQQQITRRQEDELHYKGVLEERARLAQELHDGLQQGLTGVALQLDAASKLRARDADGSARHLDLARALIRQTHADLRDSIWNLRARGMEKFNLAAALTESARRATAGTGIEVAVHTAGPSPALSDPQAENLLRIGQEAITNALKHAAAHHIEVRVESRDDHAILSVRDDGCGFARDDTAHNPSTGHFGLSGMTERARRCNGTLTIESIPGQGTTVTARVPLATTTP